MKRALIIILGIILIGGGIYFFQKGKSPTVKITSTTVRRGNLEQTLTISGEIDAEEKAILKFPTAGKLVSLPLKEGASVKKGQLLASLDQRQLKNDLSQLLNSYMNSRWSFDQTKSDQHTAADTGATDIIRERAKRLIDQSQFTLNNSVLDVEAQALAIEFSQLISPISGIVTKTPSRVPGITVTTQDSFEIINPTSWYFSALADQTEVTKLQQGLAGQLVLDSFPEATIPGVIKTISYIPKENESGTIYTVQIGLSDIHTELPYRLGMTGDISFITETIPNTLILPTKFVKSENGKQYIIVEKNNKREKQEVTVGRETDTEIELLSGASEGTTVYDQT